MKFSRNQITLAVALLALIAVSSAVYVKSTSNSKKNSATVNPRTDTAASSKDTGSNHPGQGSAGANTATSNVTPTPIATDPKYSSDKLAKPTASLNKHSISLSSNEPQSSPNLESSVSTVAGAQVQITITNADGSKTFYTPAKTADGSGAAVFEWDASADPTKLSAGTWAVIAVVTKDGQSVSSYADTLTVAK